MYWFRALPLGFEPGRPIPEKTPGTVTRSASSGSFADWDGDGDLDMIVGNINGAVYWAKNAGSKTQFDFGARVPLLANGQPLTAKGGKANPIVVDWDGDGTLDLLLGCGDGSVLFCKGLILDLSGQPTLQTPIPLTADGQPLILKSRVKLFVYDWNKDGRLDLLAGNFFTQDGAYGGNVYLMLRQPVALK